MPSRKPPKGCFWHNGTLYARAQVKGRDHKWSLRTDDPKIAKARRKAEHDELIARSYYGDNRRTFAETLEAWGPWIVNQVGPATAKRYVVSLGQLQPFYDGKKLDEINGKLIAEIITGRQAVDRVTNATIKRDLVALSSVLNFAIDQAWVESNPVLPRLQRLKERRDPIALPLAADVDKVIARAPGYLALMIRAARLTGCRQEELAGAERSQLDIERRRLTVKGKRGKVREIDLEPFEAWRPFAALPAGLPRTPLFWHGPGERYANVASRFAVLTAEIAAKDPAFRRFCFHHLRHLHAVEWLRSGRSIYVLQQRLGHGSLKTTEVYLSYLTPEEQQRAKGT